MQTYKLGEIAQYINGRAFKPTEWELEGLPIIRIQNLNNKDAVFNFSAKKNDDKYLITKGDLLFARSGSLGTFIWDREDGRLNQHIFKVIPNETIVNKKFLFFALTSLTRKFESKTHGATMVHITKPEFLKIQIPLPPLSEQQAIATKLDQLQHLIDLKQQAITKTDELAKSIFLEMFGDPLTNEKGWEMKKFKEIGKVQGGATIKSTEFVKDGIPVIRIGTANKGYIDLANAVYLSQDIAKKYDKYSIYPGDLVLTLTGTVGKEDYGNICIVNDTYKKYILNQRVAKLEINNKVIKKEFFAYFIARPEIKSQLTGVSRGVRQANISNADIDKLDIILPPLSLQQQFADLITEIESQKSAHKQALAKLEDLYQNEMQRSFSM